MRVDIKCQWRMRFGLLIELLKRVASTVVLVCIWSLADPSLAGNADPAALPSAAELTAMDSEALFAAADALVSFGQKLELKAKAAISAKDCPALKTTMQQFLFFRDKSRVLEAELSERTKIDDIKLKAVRARRALRDTPSDPNTEYEMELAMLDHCRPAQEPDPYIERYEQMERLAKVDISQGQAFVDGTEKALANAVTCEELKDLAEDTRIRLGTVTSTIGFVEEYCPCRPDTAPYREHEALKSLRDKLSSFLVRVHGEILRRCKTEEIRQAVQPRATTGYQFGLTPKISDGPSLKTVEKTYSTNQCPGFAPDLRIRLLAPHAAAMMEKFKLRPTAFATKNYKPYYDGLVAKWVLFLETYYAICATPEDLKAFPPEIASLTVVFPGTRLPGSTAGDDVIGADAVKKRLEGYNAADIAALRKKLTEENGGADVAETDTAAGAVNEAKEGAVQPPPSTPPPPASDGTAKAESSGDGTSTGPGTATTDGAPPPARKKTTSRKEKPKKKGDVAEAPKDAPANPPKPGSPSEPPKPSPRPPEEGGPPRRIGDDPEKGIGVAGGTLRRGTTIVRLPTGDRPAISAWVESGDKNVCRKHKFYQFFRVDFFSQWGSGPEKDANPDMAKLIAKNHKGIETHTGSEAIPGSWSADDYRDTNKENLDKQAKFTPPGGEAIAAGPYRPLDIPGVKKASGFVDAPSWLAPFGTDKYLKAVAPASLAKAPDPRVQPDQPAAIPLGKVRVVQKFRTELHCHEPDAACLGYFTWEYEETISLSWEWKIPVDGKAKVPELGMGKGSAGGIRNDAEKAAEEKTRPRTWVAALKAASVINGPRNITDWQSDCTK